MLTIYMDEHVSIVITKGLRMRGVTVITAQEDRHANTPDVFVLNRAHSLGCILFTQDDDFLAEANKRQRQGLPFSGIVYAHQLSITIGRCIEDLELIVKTTSISELHNSVIYLPV